MQSALAARRSLVALLSLVAALASLSAPAAAQQPISDPIPPPPPSGYNDASPPAPGGTALYPAPGGTTAVPPPGASSTGYPAQAGQNNLVVQGAEPTRVRYHGGPIPAGAYIESSRRAGLYIPGLVIFGLSYASSVYDALVYPGVPNTQYLAIPVLGPIIFGNRDQSMSPYLVMNSILQAAGLVLFIAGFPKKDYLVIPAGAQHQVAFSPIVGRGLFGVGLTIH